MRLKCVCVCVFFFFSFVLVTELVKIVCTSVIISRPALLQAIKAVLLIPSANAAANWNSIYAFSLGHAVVSAKSTAQAGVATCCTFRNQTI